MCRNLFPLLLFPLLLAACGQPGTERSYSTNPGTDSSITFDVSSDSASKAVFTFPDTIALRMDSTGKITWMDKKAIKMTDLQQLVQDSLISVFLHTGKLPSHLDMQYLGTVTMGIRGAADDEIRQAQVVLRNVIAAKTLNRSYGRLDGKEQKKFEKQYPAIFQQYY
jgi:hypothetical protein